MPRFGRYELVELIGRGGMAEVWKADLVGPSGYARRFALKRIHATRDGDPEVAALFLREASVMARLRHRNVVQVFELDEVDGRPFLAMEHIEGVSVFELVRSLPASEELDAGVCARVAHDVCRALAYMHDLGDVDGGPLGLVHRDVSPHNIMISVDGVVKLLDFGVSKPTEHRDGLTRTGVTRGKRGYMSWEQLDGLMLDPRADVFSIGVVLWEMLTARRLFDERSDLDALRDQRVAVLRPPSELRVTKSAALDDICARALAFDAADRYPDAATMADALQEIVTSSGVRDQQLAALARRARVAATPPRRRRALVWWAAPICVLLVGAAFLLRARHHEEAHVLPPPPRQTSPSPSPPPLPAPATAPGVALDRPARPTKHAQPEHKRVRDLGRGDIVDPFAPSTK